MKLTPSKNPEKESKQFAIIAIIGGVVSLFIWYFGIVGIACGVRGAILSKRVKSAKYLALSVIGAILGLVSMVYYYAQS